MDGADDAVVTTTGYAATGIHTPPRQAVPATLSARDARQNQRQQPQGKYHPHNMSRQSLEFHGYSPYTFSQEAGYKLGFQTRPKHAQTQLHLPGH